MTSPLSFAITTPSLRNSLTVIARFAKFVEREYYYNTTEKSFVLLRNGYFIGPTPN